MSKENRLIHLHTFLFDDYHAMQRILQFDPQLKNLYQYSPSYLSSTFRMSKRTSEKLYRQLHSTSIYDILEQHSKKNIEMITIYSDVYPFYLKEIHDPPFVLYCKGNHNLLKTKKLISMIGSRKPSNFAKINSDSIINELVGDRWVIVSGLALGCDAIAHRSTILHHGKTIAIIGSGLDFTYPKENLTLYQEIAENHLLISEYPHYIKPEKRYFPRRNRIIAGLSKGLIILEANERSGTMITANFALDYGREVFVVPGPIIMEEYKGNHRLIQEGAKLITSSKDILEEFIEFTKK